MKASAKKVRMLGIRGIPACHGGFETCAEHVALHLANRGWDVTVYCQKIGSGAICESYWHGVRLIHVPVDQDGVLGTIIFDWKSTLHACRESGVVLTFGYNTAVFCAMYRVNGITNIINMDGFEWKRRRWGRLEKCWLYLNEWAGAALGNYLIADHPEMMRHLQSRTSSGKITVITYDAPRIWSADPTVLQEYGLEPKNYALIVARPQPDNNVLEVVRAWSRQRRQIKLVVLGNYAPETAYGKSVRIAASDEVVFPGAIYDNQVVSTLRCHARLYLHGHQVGGTNPSLVEALGAGNAVLAHDNPFNRWVAGEGAYYFCDENNCARMLDLLLEDQASLSKLQKESARRHAEEFTADKILSQYEAMLLSAARGSREQIAHKGKKSWLMR